MSLITKHTDAALNELLKTNIHASMMIASNETESSLRVQSPAASGQEQQSQEPGNGHHPHAPAGHRLGSASLTETQLESHLDAGATSVTYL